MSCSVGPTPSLPVVLIGDRTTGALHFGHYVGSLKARVALQHTSQQYLLLADLQAMTDNTSRVHKVSENVLVVAIDYLACGIDPLKSTIFIQSQVPELAELSLLLLNLVTVSRLERNPTIRQEIALRGFERGIPAGFLMYPVSQAADIAAFRATLVPVGADQLPMIEQTNELVRRFNKVVRRDVLAECRALLSDTPRLPGTDGKTKMSKSLGNAITLGASADEVRRAVNRMYTDEKHLRIEDPGQVEGNVVFDFLDVFDADASGLSKLKDGYRRGGIADSLVKRRLVERLESLLQPIRDERTRLAKDKGAVLGVLREGCLRARERAAHTVDDVKRALGLSYF